MTEKTHGLGSKDPAVKLMQLALNERLGTSLSADGVFGKLTQGALRAYQASVGIKETNAAGACYGPLTRASLFSRTTALVVEGTHSLGSKDPAVKLMQRALNEKMGLAMKCDGDFGRTTQAALSTYQASIGVKESDVRGAYYGPKTQAALGAHITARFLMPGDIVDAAGSLGVDVASVEAILVVETKEFGFLPSGHTTVLFERHKFYRDLIRTRGEAFALATSVSHRDICNPVPGGYLGGQHEVKRLNDAMAIEKNSALRSASYGLGQCMGFNHKACGYDTVSAFVLAMQTSERLQLQAVVSFIKFDRALLKALQARQWSTVARIYNGPNFAAGGYHLKLAAEYKKASKT
jgi:peptidoglycan hydrolase-like protein with peptidoglycan-binding domain